MSIKTTFFIKSSTGYKQCPADARPEVALIGRSNVGKSSLINMLVQKKKLAKVSSTPGKTQLINHFLINEKYYLVDLPGYGWAKVGQRKKKEWEKMILHYLLYRKNLVEILLLIDIRLPPQKIDLEFIEWLFQAGKLFSIVFTKSDKLSKQQVSAQVHTFQQKLKDQFGTINCLVTSSSMCAGREELIDYLAKRMAS